jgi:hypothetical protein
MVRDISVPRSDAQLGWLLGSSVLELSVAAAVMYAGLEKTRGMQYRSEHF